MPRTLFLLLPAAAVAVAAAFSQPATGAAMTESPTAPVVDEGSAPAKREVQPPVAPEPAPGPTARLADLPSETDLLQKAQSYFAGHQGQRIYVQVDKPLYKPGETIWIKTWHLGVQALAGSGHNGITYQLVSPKGAVVLEKHVPQAAGSATNDFELPAEAQGGEYQIRVRGQDGTSVDRPVIVSTYEPPRVKKKLEFVRKAYGEGDTVTATIEVKRPTGEPLGNKALAAAITVDGVALPRVALTTNAEGGGLVKFTLPAKIDVGDGLLTVLVEDGGVTESISKSIPIIVRKLQFAAFPEGGKLVQGLASRLYFEAKTPIGKPADVEGRVVDDHGNAVAAFATYKNGLGRIDFTPQTGRTYKAEITKPVGVTEKYALPLPEESGCVLRAFDDLDGLLPAMRVSVTCSESRKLVVAAVLREKVLDAASIEARAGEAAIVYLQPKDLALAHAQGIARITVFDDKLNPLAERLVFRNRRRGLKVKVKPEHKEYSPREQVALQITTTDSADQPVAAEVALSVVDDTVVSFADDKTGHLLSRLFLEPEVPGKVEEPNFYFDATEAKSALAMDLLLGTRGWRTFEWQQVLRPPPPPPMYPMSAMNAMDDGMVPRPMAMPPPAPKGAALPRAVPLPAPGAKDKQEQKAKEQPARVAQAQAAPVVAAAPPPPGVPVPMREMAKKRRMEEPRVQELRADVMEDRDFRGGAAGKVAFAPPPFQWAAVRVFPAPQYEAGYTGPRTDFRETIFWAPAVKTGADGKATVKFFASDAITSFRTFTEGVGGGLAGRDETVFKSSLPFSLSIKLPVEVSAGDKLVLPVTLSNERNTTLDVTLDASFGPLLQKAGDFGRGGQLAAGTRRSLWFPLDVIGNKGTSEVHLKATTGSLSDEVTRQITVTPLGFPQLISRAGQVKDRAAIEFDLGKAIPGSAEVSVRVYPSPLSTMVAGLEGMLREPSGCFEQTSSTNYPNVMVMQYLKSHDIVDSALLERSGKLLDSGYRRLTGYETPQKGYEWFGGAPGHEALTAYGLLEFADMKAVYGNVDDAMMVRTASWLRKRRDGKGGYLRDPKALDSFGGASPEVTNAYITWSLLLAGETGLEPELGAMADLAGTTQDQYLLALAADSLLHSAPHKSQGLAAAKRLAAGQGSDGSFAKAAMSITRSGGVNLTIETTSLAVLALIDAGGHDAEVRNAVQWLSSNRSGFGQWGATQATVLALKAIIAYENTQRKTQLPGKVSLRINGEPEGAVAYEAGRREAIVFTSTKLHAGSNKVELVSSSGEPLPYSLAVEFRSLLPATSPQAVVDLSTSLAANELKMGETVRLTSVVTNKTQSGQPMTIARVGIPGGLSFQTWQLKELREKGVIGFYETRAREVIFYFRDLKPGEVKTVPVDLVATIPGTFTAPASSAYLYYTDEHKTWVPAVSVTVKP
jgi:hypothetical protein